MTMIAKYEIVIDNEDGQNGAPETPWTATLFNIRNGVDGDTGETGDALAVGVGISVYEAIIDLATAVPTIPGDLADPCSEAEDGVAHQVSDGSCDLCGAKNFN